MNLFEIIDEIEKVDPEIQERLNPRRAAIKNITSFGSKVAAATMPFALGTLFKKAYGQTVTPTVLDVLNFALTAEYLGATFYNTATANGVIPAANAAYIANVTRDENAHVAFLISTITASGGVPVSKPEIDLSGGNGTGTGPFASAVKEFKSFLTLSQVLEDTEVRAYKGQAGALKGNQTILTAALSIHAVEARHASAIRLLRHDLGYDVNTKPWIVSITTGNDTGNPLVDANYAGEENTVQGGVDLKSLAATGIVTASFDEPLTKEQVLAILSGTFLVKR